MGTPFVAWQNVVVGDPLTRIYNYQTVTLSGNNTLQTGVYKHRIIVPEGSTLTIPSSAEITFERNAQLIIEGDLVIENGAVVTFDGYSRLIVKDNFQPIANSNIILTGNAFTDIKNFYLDENVLLSLSENAQITGDVYIMEANSTISSQGNSYMLFNNVSIAERCSLIINSISGLTAQKSLYINGTSSNPVNVISTSNSGGIVYKGDEGAEIYFTDFNNVIMKIYNIPENSYNELIKIENCSFTGGIVQLYIKGEFEKQSEIIINNCDFTGFSERAIESLDYFSCKILNSNFTV